MDNKNSWTPDIESILENIRLNSILLSSEHRKAYFQLESSLKYFRIPVIVISAFSSVFNVGLQPYLKQSIISVICCMLSLTTGLIGSIELFLSIQKKMENELINSKDFYLNAIDIYKVLSLNIDNRNQDALSYLEERYNNYCKLIENSDVINKKVSDKLAPIPVNLTSISINSNISPLSSKNGSDSDNENQLK